MAVPHRLADGLLGSVVALLTAPTGIGPTLGGYLAAHRAETPVGALLVSGAVGVVAALPWTGLVYLAVSGAIEPVGFHEGNVHVGVNTAPPEAFALWQELALAGLCGGLFVGAALVGGLLAGVWTAVGDELRAELTTAVRG